MFFFFNDTATTEIYTLSLHDALPIWTHPLDHAHLGGLALEEAEAGERLRELVPTLLTGFRQVVRELAQSTDGRSEEHTSELQSRLHLVCRLLLEKKKTKLCRLRPSAS